jgi:hypothetical protein
MKRTRLSRERWREIIARQQNSGLPVVTYCWRMKIPQTSFYAWRRKLRDAVTFAEVKLAPAPAAEGRGLELRLTGGRSILVRPGFDPQTLRELLATLEAGG